MPLRETKGAASAQGFGAGINGNTSLQAPYVDDVFSTYLYNGNGGYNTVNNGIPLATSSSAITVGSYSDTSGSSSYYFNYTSSCNDVNGNRYFIATNNSSDAFITKISSSNAVVYSIKLAAQSIREGQPYADSSGNLFIATYGSRIIKIDSTGSSVTGIQSISKGGFSVTWSGCVGDASGNIYAFSSFYAGGTNYPGLIVKYNSSFVPQWTKVLDFGSNKTYITGAVLDASGTNIFVFGYRIDASSNYRAYVGKFNASTGADVASWYATSPNLGNPPQAGRCIDIDPSDNIYITAPGYTYKLNSSLVTQWGMTNNSNATSVRYLSGNLYLASSSGVLKVSASNGTTVSFINNNIAGTSGSSSFFTQDTLTVTDQGIGVFNYAAQSIAFAILPLDGTGFGGYGPTNANYSTTITYAGGLSSSIAWPPTASSPTTTTQTGGYIDTNPTSSAYSATPTTFMLSTVTYPSVTSTDGLVWIKNRTNSLSAGYSHCLMDTVRGANKYLNTNNAQAETNTPTINFAFNIDGFSQNNTFGFINNNTNSENYVSWTFRKASKFFDVVTYTGDGVSGRSINHNLGSQPGFVIVKATSTTGQWYTVIKTGTNYWWRSLWLNSTQAGDNNGGAGFTFNSVITATSFQPAVVADGLVANGNATGVSYVAYLFANDTSSNGIIQCGSYTGNGSTSGPSITLGWEPQFVMVKQSSSAGENWYIEDILRGMSLSGSTILRANATSVEQDLGSSSILPNATGFTITSASTAFNQSGQTYIYIAIRRPNKPPTSGTDVYSPTISNAIEGTQVNTGFPIDFQMAKLRSGVAGHVDQDRLRGISTVISTSASRVINSNTNSPESAQTGPSRYWNSTGFQVPAYFDSQSYSYQNFKRAPGFFDEVCYTGTGVGRSLQHNLTVAPELIIVKNRSSSYDWNVYSSSLGNTSYLILDANYAVSTGSTVWNSTNPTSSVFSVGTQFSVNQSGDNYVAYLFASCAGISKIGSYTGTGATQTINCGFTGGARYVMIKRTDTTGDWYEWDTARGMVSGTDPYLLLNTQDAEVNANSVYTVTTGFQIVSTAAGINASGGSYIFFAVA